MFTYLNKQTQIIEGISVIHFLKNTDSIENLHLSEAEQAFVKEQIEENDKKSFVFDRLQYQIFLEYPESNENAFHFLESLRKKEMRF